MSTTKTRPVVLTGDRTTGSLHLGHYVGSLKRRLELQEDHRQFLLLADAQALTDNADDPARIGRNVCEVAPRWRATATQGLKARLRQEWSFLFG
jgi:tryptophanyl-tRNA synthetase